MIFQSFFTEFLKVASFLRGIVLLLVEELENKFKVALQSVHEAFNAFEVKGRVKGVDRIIYEGVQRGILGVLQKISYLL